MGSFDYLQTLQDDLLAGKITWEDALTQVQAKNRNPWQKADWKKRRLEVLDDHCGACGSAAPPLVVQHIWHPETVDDWCHVAWQDILDTTNYMEEFPYPDQYPNVSEEEIPVQPFELREMCPHCGSRNIKKIVGGTKDGEWFCHYNGKKGPCHKTFSVPQVIKHYRYTPETWLEYHQKNLLRQAQNAWRQAFWAVYGNNVMTTAIVLHLRDFQRYVNLEKEDVVTRCKKCAFKEDLDFIRIGYRYGVYKERQTAKEPTAVP